MRRAPRAFACASLFLARASIAPPAAAQQPEVRAEGEASEPPKLRKFAEATYPPDAEREGLEASVVLALRIDAAGRVESAEVQAGAGRGFDEAALAAARAFEFEPARRGGRPIASKILYRYEFRRPAAPPAAAPPPPAATPARGLLRGRVALGASGEPLGGARVSLRPKAPPPAPREARTREDGTWEFADLPPGAYEVRVAAEGFEGLAAEERVAGGEATELVYRLKVATDTAEVTVRGEPPPREVTRRTLSQRELSRVPGTGGDALRAIQNLPGVARSPGASALLIVRGAAPEETQIFVDGTPVPNVYHFGGFSSVLPTESLEKIDFYPSNFGAPYGRATGGVVDVRTRGARQDGKYHGLAQVDLIDARLLAEGPLPFLPNTTFLIAGRRSHLDAWIGPILERGGGVGGVRAPVYYDYQAFLETRPAPGARLRLGYFGADDRLRLFIRTPPENEPALGGAAGAGTAFGRLQLLYQQQLSPDVSLSAVAAYGFDETKLYAGALRIGIDERPFSSRAELSARLAPWLTLRGGEDIIYSNVDLDIRAPAPPRPGEPDSGAINSQRLLTRRGGSQVFTPAAFAEAELRPLPRLRLLVGGRADYSNRTSRWDGSVRSSARYDLVPGGAGSLRTTLKGGAGTYHQAPNDQETDPVFGSTRLRSVRATHYALGFEQEFGRQVELSAEGYYKDLDDLVGRRPTAEGTGYFNAGSGRVYGGEFLLRYKPDEHFFGWVAYSLSRSERREFPDQKMALFQYDQTHVLTALGSYRLGRGWEVGARFRLVSGPLYTPCAGLGATFDSSQASYACNSGAAFSRRLPLFHQLDVRVDKTWALGGGAKLSAYLDLWNAYNRGNVEDVSYNFNFTRTTNETGLPVVPSLGVRGEFLAMRPTAPRSAALALALASPALLPGCGDDLEPGSSLAGVRVLAVKVSEPYAAPGEALRLEMLAVDGARAGTPPRPLEVVWFDGCVNPDGGLFYSCYPPLTRALDEAFGGAPAPLDGSAPLPPFITRGAARELVVPADALSALPPPPPSVPPLGRVVTFFAACGGRVEYAPGERQVGLPLRCVDPATGAPLGADDFVFGFTPVVVADGLRNAHPAFAALTLDGAPPPSASCAGDEGCGANERCGSAGVCLRALARCGEAEPEDCDEHRLEVALAPGASEPDPLASGFEGRPAVEALFVKFYATSGRFTRGVVALVGPDGAATDEPFGLFTGHGAAPGEEARVYAVAHDSRGGAAWASFDVVFE